MASTQTPHYHLNQWISTDAVQRVEFNQNFTAIDTALHTLDQNLLLKGSASDLAELSATVSALSGEVAGKAEASALSAVSAQIPQLVFGTYTGNGEYDSDSSYTSVSQTINLGFKPKAVLVMSETGGMDSGSGRYYGGMAWAGSNLVVFLDTNYGDINANVITLTNSGFTVYVQRVQMSSSSYRYIATNEDGLKYRYIVFY